MRKSSLHLDDETHRMLHALKEHKACSIQDVIREGIQKLYRQEIEKPITVPAPFYNYDVTKFMQQVSNWIADQKVQKGDNEAA